MATKLTPLFNHILLIRDTAEEVTQGGIAIPKIAQERPTTGTILACGRGYRSTEPAFDPSGLTGSFFHPMTVREGDRVLFMDYAGFQIELDGKEVWVLTEEDIIGVLSDDNTTPQGQIN